MTTVIHREVERARSGEHPQLIARLRSGFAVLSERQVLRGYSMLLPDPVVADLNALPGPSRSAFLLDMTALGDALLAVTAAAGVDYEILGTARPALHAHVIPRYDDEEVSLRQRPFWFYDWSVAATFEPARDRELIEAMVRELRGLGLLS